MPLIFKLLGSKITLLSLGFLLIYGNLSSQNPYDASWKAGILGHDQNPASIAAAPFKGEWMIGAIDLGAQNSLFSTNKLGDQLPTSLLSGLKSAPSTLPFFTDIRTFDISPDTNQVWNASNLNKGKVLGVYFRMKNNPDHVERGIARKVIGFYFERQEQITLKNLDYNLALAYQNNFQNLGDLSIRHDLGEIKYREWDALGLNLGLSIGTGRNLLHLVLGGKFLSAGSFMDFQIHNSNLNILPGNNFSIDADSINFAYNPSFSSAISPNGKRRFGFFEGSFGYAGELGFIYEIRNTNLSPAYHFGISIQNLGVIQYWNLENKSHIIPNQVISYDQVNAVSSASGSINNLLSSMDSQTIVKAEGVTERLPLLITTHVKARIANSKWSVQYRGDFQKEAHSQSWTSYLRGTLSYESKGLGFFFPISNSTQLPRVKSQDGNTHLGFLMAIGDVLILGSNNILSNFFRASTRKGTFNNHLFLGFHLPIEKG